MKKNFINLFDEILKLTYDSFLFLIISTIFFLIMSPIGIILRVFKIDLLNLKKNKGKTYWKVKKKTNNMKKQY